jgi:hypothetical protein
MVVKGCRKAPKNADIFVQGSMTSTLPAIRYLYTRSPVTVVVTSRFERFEMIRTSNDGNTLQ